MSGVESEDGNVVELALQYLQRQNKTFCKFISLLCENRRGHVLGCLCLFVCLSGRFRTDRRWFRNHAQWLKDHAC